MCTHGQNSENRWYRDSAQHSAPEVSAPTVRWVEVINSLLPKPHVYFNAYQEKLKPENKRQIFYRKGVIQKFLLRHTCCQKKKCISCNETSKGKATGVQTLELRNARSGVTPPGFQGQRPPALNPNSCTPGVFKLRIKEAIFHHKKCLHPAPFSKAVGASI